MSWLIRLSVFFASAYFLSSCGSSNPVLSTEHLVTANNDAVLEIITDEIDDLASVVLNAYSDSGSASNGRMEAITDDRLICGTTFVFSNVAPDNTYGTVTITFAAAGCKDLKGNIRKGAFVISWANGRWYKQQSTHVVTLNNYTINDISITGTRILTCTTFAFVSSKSLAVTWVLAGDHTLTWPDGSSATFTVSKTRN